MSFQVRIHDTDRGVEYKADYHKARFPALICQQCCKRRVDKDLNCPQCGQLLVTRRMIKLPDNGALVSCGLSVGGNEDEVRPTDLVYLIATGQATRVPDEQKGHGGCQSRCILRGDDKCQW